MIKFNIFPKLLRFIMLTSLLQLLFFTGMRIIFLIIFYNDHIPPEVLFKSFYLGFKFDLRLTLLINLLTLILGWIPLLRVFKRPSWWVIYFTLVNSIVVLFYITDFGYFEYLGTRLDATALRFLYNLRDAGLMIWQSYPVIPGFIGMLLMIAMLAFLSQKTIAMIDRRPALTMAKWKTSLLVTGFILFYLAGIYGKFSYYPLRWSDAFFSTHAFASSLTLNPVLYFFDTLKNKDSSFDQKLTRKYYQTMADFLGVDQPDSENLNFIRQQEARTPKSGPVNVILVFLESFTYYKTGVSGNPLKPTPNFDRLSHQGALFSRYYTPHGGTARSIFTAITGLPDIEPIKTSSRNPRIVQQHTIINAFQKAAKFYFLGGSASWGEIRGLLAHNIPDIQLFEEGSYSSPRVDVWGISDLSLFEEAHQILSKVKEPFFAVIQTAGNHKPYTIPAYNRGFKVVSANAEEVKKYGFRSVAAYNSFRFMDHTIGVFMDDAKKAGYFKNTIFAFFGDHGLVRKAAHMTKAEEDLVLTRYHVPLLIYAPGRLKPGIHPKIASEVDLLPTIADLAGIPYINTTLGRSLFNPRFDQERYAFTIKHSQVPEIGLIGDQFCFAIKANGSDARLHSINASQPAKNVIAQHPQIGAKLKKLCLGYYETIRYMRFNNALDKKNKEL